RPDDVAGGSRLRRAFRATGPGRRQQARASGHHPLALSGLHRLFRETAGNQHRADPDHRRRPEALIQANHTMTALPFWPAEWAPQDGILLAWPHSDTDWVDNLEDVESTYGALLAAITRYQRA